MQHFYLVLQALSPLAIRSDHAEGGANTTQHITGTTFLGSLAAAHRLLRPAQEDEFADLFLKDRIYFPYLYPASFKKSSSGIGESNLPVLPLPKTAQSCKRFSGFQPLPGENTDEKRHGIRDSLLDWAAFSLLDKDEEQQPTSALLAPLKQHMYCIYKDCKEPMDHISGYYRCARNHPEQKMKASVQTRLQTHTGINREWGVVEEGILYNREVFDKHMHFWGDVIVPDELVTTFEGFVAEANEEKVIRVGTGRTRGLGKALLQIRRAKSGNFIDFKNRLIDFDTKLKERAQEVGVKNLKPFFYLSITLHSATILCDPFMRYRQTIDENVLSELLDYPTITFKRIYQATEVQRVSGWNEQWGTPRTSEYAIEMGSTFLFECSRKPDEEHMKALYQLEQDGIGRRRMEGFGRICISDPFHLEGVQA